MRGARWVIRDCDARGVGRVLAGCWTVLRAGLQRLGHNQFESAITTANVASLSKEWTWQADWTTPCEVSDPVVSVNGVHVAVGHELVTIRPTDGVERWRTPLFAASSATQGVLAARNPAAANGRVFESIQSVTVLVGTKDGRVISFRPGDSG